MSERQAELSELVAGLAAAFPRVQVGRETLSVYVRALADLPLGEIKAATGFAIRTSPFFPTVAELRQTVARNRLSLPDAVTAWEQVGAFSFHRPTWEDCGECDGGRLVDPEKVCPRCRDEGRVDVRPREQLHPIVARALASVGGPTAVREAREPGIVRAQFFKAYELLGLEAVMALASGGPSRARSASPALEPPQVGDRMVESGESGREP